MLLRAPPRIFCAASALSASVGVLGMSTARPSASSGGTPLSTVVRSSQAWW